MLPRLFGPRLFGPLFKKRTNSLLWTVGVGLCLCLGQVTFTWIFSPKDLAPANKYYLMVQVEGWNGEPGSSPLTTGYLRFNNWDSLRFFEIAKNGYHMPPRPVIEDDIHHYRANITTPPAYPLAVRCITWLLGVPVEVALLISAQLACWGFWIYFLLLLTDFGLTRKQTLWSAWVVAVHPAAFYLVVGYTESLLMMSLLGLIYWTHRYLKFDGNRREYWLLAGVHGFVGTATRLAGFPLALFPALHAFSTRRKKWFSGLALSALSMFGLISFFIFCQIKFGRWDLYFKLSGMLGQTAQVFAFLDWKSYIPHYFFEHSMISLNRTASLIIFAIATQSPHC